MKGTIPVLRFTWLRTTAFHALKNIPAYLLYPFRALINRLRSGNRRFKEILLGIGICIPVIGLIILLFSDADLIFGSLMDKMFLSLQGPNLIRFPWNLAQSLILTLIIFAVIYGLNATIPVESTPTRSFILPRLTIAFLLSVMSFVYAAFVYIQCRYLFSGVASALIEDSYAVYARTGFFQLVIVAFITMLIVLPSLCMFPESRCVRTLSAFISLMTLVIVYSAFWRMRLYILEYGLTLLRVLTLWGILAISAAMIASLVKAIRPKAHILPVLFVFTIVTWICFNYINVYDRIADYNITAYQKGTIESVDIDYLSCLGIEVLPQLETLINEGSLSVESMGTAVEAKELFLNAKSAPYDWSLSWLKVR